MDPLAIRALALSTAFRAMGVPVTVTPPGGAPIATRGIWIVYARLTYAMDDAPAGAPLHRREPRRILGLPRADVPSVPLQTVIAAPDVGGGAVLLWLVDGYERIEADRIDVLVVPA